MGRETPRTVINIISAALWCGAIAFLLWFVITEMRKTRDTQYIVTSSTTESYISYPGMMICPSLESAKVIDANVRVKATANVFTQSYRDDDPLAYFVCPRTVNFAIPNSNFSITCVDFQMNPSKGSPVDNCPDKNSNTFWFGQGNNNDPDHPWSSIDNQASVLLFFTTEGLKSPLPLVVHFYSDNSISQTPRDGDWSSYAKLFSLTTPQRTFLPLLSYSAITVKKYIRDKYPDNKDCSFDDYYAETHIYYENPMTPVNGSSSSQTAVLSYDDLTVTKECHRAVMGFAEVLGIVGGGMSLVIACTIILAKAVEYCVQRGGGGGDSHSKPYNALNE